ncbi:hypothetical protein [Streptacidiphilus sp. EB129]|uniref:hypothetical protein n=1 Tax=Streptacidiphilus sp. EB129 TaxID=3156262 RepID=UPI003510D63B
MSAHLELLPGLRLSPLAPRRPRPPLAAVPVERAADPVEEAALRFGAVAATAVHPFEVAAAIEAEGMSDRQVQHRYGRVDAFQLAEDLYADTPRSYPEPEQAPSPWSAPLSRSLLRGVLYALPGLAFPLAGPLFAGPADACGLPHGAFALALSVLVHWAWNQALAHRTHTWLGRGGSRAAARCLLLGTGTGVILGWGAAVLAALLWERGSAGVLLFCLAQSCSMAFSCVLLVLGRESVLLRALAPGALCGAAVLLGLLRPSPLTSALLLLSLALTCREALRELSVLRGRGAPEAGWSGAAVDPVPPLRASLPHGLFGVAMSLLTLGVAVHAGRIDPAPTVALTVSMGPAEWLLYGYRDRVHGALRLARTVRGFALLSAGSVLVGLGSYLGVLAVLSGAMVAATAGDGLGRQLPALLALGAALWTALLLQATGALWAAIGVCLPAALAAVAGVAEGLVGTVAAALLLLIACRTLGRVTVHR